MKICNILYTVIIAGVIGMAGCKSENTELKTEAETIAGAMCKSIGIMNELKQANPADTALVNKLQRRYQDVQSEMIALNNEFRNKYGDKASAGEFSEEFRKYLNEAMLSCKNLSKEDRESFERGLK